MSYFKLSTNAWRRFRRHWRLPATPALTRQTYIAGGFQSAAGLMQSVLKGRQRAATAVKDPIFILGFWRSGTSLLHELLCVDQRFGYPTTWACLNPHHFLLSHARVMKLDRVRRRPQDRMVLRPSTPQEDEFALLCMGARTPYEGLMVPRNFAQAFALSDPQALSPAEQRFWRRSFVKFLKGVSLVNKGRTLVLKSPAHSYRVPTLRSLFPQARFIVIARNPFEVFESTVRTYRALTEKFGILPDLSDSELRQLILAERVNFEAKLQADIASLPKEKLATVSYEELAARPLATIEALYAQLGLPDFADVRVQLDAEITRRDGYVAELAMPGTAWKEQVADKWREIFRYYGYPIGEDAAAISATETVRGAAAA